MEPPQLTCLTLGTCICSMRQLCMRCPTLCSTKPDYGYIISTAGENLAGRKAVFAKKPYVAE